MPSNLITFKPDGESSVPMFVRLPRAFTLRAGVYPDLNQAEVSYAQLASLCADPYRTGTLEFWFSIDPQSPGAAPDVSIANLRITAIEPIHTAAPLRRATVDVSLAEPVRPIDYRITLADFRRRFVPPHGGRLLLGAINPGSTAPPVSNATQDLGADAGVPELDLPALIKLCLEAMDLGDVALPRGLGDIPAPRELRWFGNHAPTELARLLDLCGCVFLPEPDGTATLARRGEGAASSLPAHLALAPIDLPRTDPLPDTIVLTSFPTRNLVSRTLQGPSSSTLYFTAQDSDDRWKRIDDCAILPGGAASHVRDNFARVPVSYRSRARAQAYRFLKLADDLFPSGSAPILTGYVDADGATHPLQVLAPIATQDAKTGRWANSADPVAVPVQFKHAGNLLQLAARLGRVGHETADPDRDFAELSPESFAVRLTTEDAVHDPETGRWLPRYFQVGFRREGDNEELASLSEDEVSAAVSGSVPEANVAIVTRPDWRLLIVDDQERNRGGLESAARAQARRLLALPANHPQLLAARGFVPARLSGRMHRIEYDAQALQTRLWLDEPAPSGAVRQPLAGFANPAALDCAALDYPNQLHTFWARWALGESASTQPVEPTNPIAFTDRATPSFFPVLLRQAGGQDGTSTTAASWTYDVFTPDNQTQLAAAVAVEKDRPLNCSVAPATKGVAYYDNTAELRLWDTNERLAQTNCT